MRLRHRFGSAGRAELRERTREQRLHRLTTDAELFCDLRIRRSRRDETHRVALDRIAEELLVREVLDADQVRALVAGKTLDEFKPATAGVPDEASKRTPKERPSIVPPLPPLNKPLPQE